MRTRAGMLVDSVRRLLHLQKYAWAGFAVFPGSKHAAVEKGLKEAVQGRLSGMGWPLGAAFSVTT